MKNTAEKQSVLTRPRGRPRAFDRDRALAAALETFWRLGYEGASIADLTAAMDITPQSLYAAFRSKAALYREALALYRTETGREIEQALDTEPDIVSALSRVMRGLAPAFACPQSPKGCMISTAVLACAVEHDPVAAHVAGLRGETIALYERLIRQSVDEGILDADTDPSALARYLGAIMQGMSVQARDGADESELAAIAEIAVAELERRRVRRRDRPPLRP